MTAEYLLDRRKRGLEGRIVEPALSEYRRIACRHQEHITLAQRDVEAFAEMQHHLARGLRLARFEDAQVSCRNLGIERQTELRHAPALAPFADAVPDVAGLGGGARPYSVASIPRRWRSSRRTPSAFSSSAIDLEMAG